MVPEPIPQNNRSIEFIDLNKQHNAGNTKTMRQKGKNSFTSGETFSFVQPLNLLSPKLKRVSENGEAFRPSNHNISRETCYFILKSIP